MVAYWLMKSEPESYSIEDLKRDGKTAWEGVRNYQARNFMKDRMHIGDLVLFYHSNAKPPGVAGIGKICSHPYPDATALDPNSRYFDPKASKDHPIWFLVDVAFVEQLPRLISLDEIRQLPECSNMALLKPGQRLSIQPVTKAEFDTIKNAAKK